jgi:flagellar biosynthesis/type III secretory pathway M-ring protein FliF/YscJ
MREFLGELLKQVKGIWSRLDGGQRLTVVAVLLSAAVGLGALVVYAGQPTYMSVYSAASGEELQQAQRLLGQAGIKYRTDDAGVNVMVDRADAARANAAINAGGLRGGGDHSFTGTSLVEDADTKAYRLDLASRGQAARAIEGLDGVISATVAASRPRRSPFANRDQESQARATVALRIKSGVPFEAIAHSAASLAASQLMVPIGSVEVVNASTHQRWQYDPERVAGGVGSGDFLLQQRRLADERTALAQSALDALYPGKTAVTVGVELDPEWEVRSEKVLPAEPLVRTEKSTTDSTENQPAVRSGGDPSTAATVTEQAIPGKNNTKKETRDREFVTEVGERKSGRLAPAIKRLSVALLYDKALERQEGFSRDDLAKVVKSIVGWDQKRDSDDGFSTMAGVFAEEVPAATATGAGVMELVASWAPLLVQLGGVVLVLLFLRSLFRRPRAHAAQAPESAAPGEDQLAPEEQARRMRREIERSIASDPAALAKLLESWLQEQKA